MSLDILDKKIDKYIKAYKKVQEIWFWLDKRLGIIKINLFANEEKIDHIKDNILRLLLVNAKKTEELLNIRVKTWPRWYYNDPLYDIFSLSSKDISFEIDLCKILQVDFFDYGLNLIWAQQGISIFSKSKLNKEFIKHNLHTILQYISHDEVRNLLLLSNNKEDFLHPKKYKSHIDNQKHWYLDNKIMNYSKKMSCLFQTLSLAPKEFMGYIPFIKQYGIQHLSILYLYNSILSHRPIEKIPIEDLLYILYWYKNNSKVWFALNHIGDSHAERLSYRMDNIQNIDKKNFTIDNKISHIENHHNNSNTIIVRNFDNIQQQYPIPESITNAQLSYLIGLHSNRRDLVQYFLSVWKSRERFLDQQFMHIMDITEWNTNLSSTDESYAITYMHSKLWYEPEYILSAEWNKVYDFIRNYRESIDFLEEKLWLEFEYIYNIEPRDILNLIRINKKWYQFSIDVLWLNKEDILSTKTIHIIEFIHNNIWIFESAFSKLWDLSYEKVKKFINHTDTNKNFEKFSRYKQYLWGDYLETLKRETYIEKPELLEQVTKDIEDGRSQYHNSFNIIKSLSQVKEAEQAIDNPTHIIHKLEQSSQEISTEKSIITSLDNLTPTQQQELIERLDQRYRHMHSIGAKLHVNTTSHEEIGTRLTKVFEIWWFKSIHADTCRNLPPTHTPDELIAILTQLWSIGVFNDKKPQLQTCHPGRVHQMSGLLGVYALMMSKVNTQYASDAFGTSHESLTRSRLLIFDAGVYNPMFKYNPRDHIGRTDVLGNQDITIPYVNHLIANLLSQAQYGWPLQRLWEKFIRDSMDILAKYHMDFDMNHNRVFNPDKDHFTKQDDTDHFHMINMYTQKRETDKIEQSLYWNENTLLNDLHNLLTLYRKKITILQHTV